jgi:hypothetical protein
MRVGIAALVLASLSAGASAQGSEIRGTVTLRGLRDRVRPLLVFAPKPDDARLEIQIRTLEQHAAEVQDRDMLAIALPFRSPSPTAAQLTPDDAEAARRRFHVAPDEFAVILLGKDGGSKLRSDEPLSMDQLNRTVDAMPMRQDEMRGKAQNKAQQPD